MHMDAVSMERNSSISTIQLPAHCRLGIECSMIKEGLYIGSLCSTFQDIVNVIVFKIVFIIIIVIIRDS